MAAEGYYLSEKDLADIKEMYKELMPRRVRRGAKATDWDESQSSQFYVAKTPADGIPATVEGRASYADCNIYEVSTFPEDENEDGEVLLTEVDQLVHRIFNISTGAIAGDTWIHVAKDTYGTWHVLTGGGDSSKVALLIGKEYATGQFTVYSWLELGTYDPISLTYTVVDSGGPGDKPLFHIRNLDIPVVLSFDPTVGTGTEPVPDPTGTGTGTGISVTAPDGTIYLFDELSVVRIWRGRGLPASGEYYLFSTDAWIDLLKMGPVVDDDGTQAFHRFYNQNTRAWVSGRQVRVVVAS